MSFKYCVIVQNAPKYSSKERLIVAELQTLCPVQRRVYNGQFSRFPFLQRFLKRDLQIVANASGDSEAIKALKRFQ
jgi:hypothetical protein